MGSEPKGAMASISLEKNLQERLPAAIRAGDGAPAGEERLFAAQAHSGMSPILRKQTRQFERLYQTTSSHSGVSDAQ